MQYKCQNGKEDLISVSNLNYLSLYKALELITKGRIFNFI